VTDVLLILGFAMQAGGVLAVVVAAFLHDRRQQAGLGPLVWGGVLTTSAGTLFVLVGVTLAAIVAASHH
jgi:hypothetical protein